MEGVNFSHAQRQCVTEQEGSLAVKWLHQKSGRTHPRSPEVKKMTKTISTLIIAVTLMGPAMATVRVATPAPSASVVSSDNAIVFIVPVSSLNRTASPVVRITR